MGEENRNFLPGGANRNRSKTLQKTPKTSACGGFVSTAQGSGARQGPSRGRASPSALQLLLCICAWWARERDRQACAQGILGLCLGKQGMRVGASALSFLPTSSGMTTCNATPARSARAWPCSWAVWSSGMWPLGLSLEGAHASPPMLGPWPADFPPGWEVGVDM